MASDPSPLFLLEYRPERQFGTDVDRMHRALVHAAERLSRAGAPVRFVSAILVPDEPRCLYVVAAANAGQVIRAADIAGVSIDRVRPVVGLPDAARSPVDGHRPH